MDTQCLADAKNGVNGSNSESSASQQDLLRLVLQGQLGLQQLIHDMLLDNRMLREQNEAILAHLEELTIQDPQAPDIQYLSPKGRG